MSPIFVAKIGIQGDVSLGHIAVQCVCAKLMGPANLTGKGPNEISLVPQGKRIQRCRLITQGFADCLIGVIGPKSGPVVIGAEIDIFLVVLCQIGHSINGNDIFVHIAVEVREDFILGGRLDLRQGFLAAGIKHSAPLGSDQPRHLQQQGGFADARLAADEDGRTRHQTLAQHHVQ